MANAIGGLRSSYDAVIVGARCAGAATAMLLARAGLDVLVVEQAARGTDTLSTLALMRAGVLQLSRWGLLDAIKAAGTPRIETTTFHMAITRSRFVSSRAMASTRCVRLAAPCSTCCLQTQHEPHAQTSPIVFA
jgi:2-polyprenyl-6-methoxyphenol hydroxylase-like FAD-dependent oxidoreductase